MSWIAFKSVPMRIGFVACGGGYGLGRAYVDARYTMGHEARAEVLWEAVVVTEKVVASPTTGTTVSEKTT